MNNPAIIILVVAILAIAGAAFWYYRKQRTGRLRGRFGPEYEHAVREYGDPRKAESELERRLDRSKRFHIHELPPEDRENYAEAWRQAQARFVDEPREAVLQAHRLVNQVMKARGYPVSDEFEVNAADLSADHPVVVQHYRAACGIMARHDRGRANTEDLREAMTNYRSLFEELLGARISQSEEVRR
ncbi:MAG TPA: hypothetical protein VL285_18545 [Bryobacteraceae bacterium]|jgi:hypothetical protein|nr:hypothetical protein [Bryobacteraceae bacterium]